MANGKSSRQGGFGAGGGLEPQPPVSLATVWAGVAYARVVRIRAAQDTDGIAAASVASGPLTGKAWGKP